jgi:hypothetical protein
MVEVGGFMSDTPAQPPTTDQPLDEVRGRALVEAWRVSGLSCAAYCRQHDLRSQRLNYWRERLGYPIKALGEGRTTEDQPPTKVASGFVQVVVNDVRPTSDVGIVVGGALIRVERGFDPVLLRAVVAALQAGA